jgi:hypothetical protein
MLYQTRPGQKSRSSYFITIGIAIAWKQVIVAASDEGAAFHIQLDLESIDIFKVNK